AVIRVRRDRRIRGVGADILEQPVVFGGKRGGSGSLKRRNHRQEEDWQDKPAQRAAYHQFPSNGGRRSESCRFVPRSSFYEKGKEVDLSTTIRAARESHGAKRISRQVVSRVTPRAAVRAVLFRGK